MNCMKCGQEINEADIRFSKKYFGRVPEYCEKCRREKEHRRDLAPIRECLGAWIIVNIQDLIYELNKEPERETVSKEELFTVYSAGGRGFCGGGVDYEVREFWHVDKKALKLIETEQIQPVMLRKMKKIMPDGKEYIYFVVETTNQEEAKELTNYKFFVVGNHSKITLKGFGKQYGFADIQENLNNKITIAYYADSCRTGRIKGKKYFVLEEVENDKDGI